MEDNTMTQPMPDQVQPQAMPMQSPQPQMPMQPIEEKKAGKGKVIGLIAAAMLLIGGGVFAGVKLFGKKDEPVPEPEPVAKVEPERPVVAEATGALAVRFLKMENRGENAIYSPLSIKYALSMLRDGADNETRAEIEAVLGGATLTTYQNIAEKLSLANAVFIRDSFAGYVMDDYKTKMVTDYNAEVMFDKFQSAGVLDNWVSDKTFGLIRQVGLEIKPDTEMVLANALAIQMDWASKFEYTSTHGKDFYLEDGTKMVATTMMKDETMSETVGYYKDEEVTMATLDLAKQEDGTQLEFVAVMPTQAKLKDYIGTVDLEDVLQKESAKTTADRTVDGVTLMIPKFKFEYKLSFVNDLKALGIESAFSVALADFSKMVNLEALRRDEGVDMNIYVSDAVHKANIDFSETGIKAAAVTAIAVAKGEAAMMSEPVVISIDRPFMFMIIDKDTKEVWFTGAVYEPNKWDDDVDAYVK